MRNTNWTGRDAWRNLFSVAAGDVLEIQRVFAGEEIFETALVDCVRAKGGRDGKITMAILSNVLDATIAIARGAGNG